MNTFYNRASITKKYPSIFFCRESHGSHRLKRHSPRFSFSSGSWCEWCGGSAWSASDGAPISPVMAELTETAAATGSCRCACACAAWTACACACGSCATRSWRHSPAPPPPPVPASSGSIAAPGRNDGSPDGNTSLYTRRWIVPAADLLGQIYGLMLCLRASLLLSPIGDAASLSAAASLKKQSLM